MMYMTNDEYKHYIFEQKRKGRSEEQIAESMGMQLEDFLALQAKVFGTPIAETVQEPAEEPESDDDYFKACTDFFNALAEMATEGKTPTDTDAMKELYETEPEQEKESEPTPVTVEEDESRANG